MQNMISKTNKPYFIWWDQDVTEDDVRELLKSDNLYTRITYMRHILNDAEFEDIWKFLKLKMFRKIFGVSDGALRRFKTNGNSY